MHFQFLVLLSLFLACLTLSVTLGSNVRNQRKGFRLSTLEEPIDEQNTTKQLNSTNIPIDILKGLIDIGNQFTSSDLADKTNVHNHSCLKALEFQQAARRLVNKKLEEANNYTDLLRVEEKRCAMLTLSISSSGKDDADAQSALSEIKAHCKKTSKEFAHVKSEIHRYSSTLLKVEKVVQVLVLACNSTVQQTKKVQRAFSRDNMIKNIDAITKSALHKSHLLYATVYSTANTSHAIDKVFNRDGKRVLDLLTTKLNLLNATTLQKVLESSGLKFAQLSDLRDKKYLFVQDHTQLSQIGKALNETKSVKQKYVQLLKNVQTKKEQISATLENTVAGLFKEKLLRNLTRLHDLRIETERNLQVVSQKLEHRQSMFEAAKKRVAASEAAYLAKVSSLVDEANVLPQKHYRASDIIDLIASGGQQNKTLMHIDLLSNIAKFDKKFLAVLKLELSKRGNDLFRVIKNSNQIAAYVNYLYSIIMREVATTRLEKPYLKHLNIVTADAKELPKLHAKLMQNKLKAFLGSGSSSILPVTPEKRLKKRADSDRRFMFLAFHKAQNEALKARTDYLKSRMEYEIKKLRNELGTFNKVLFHTKMPRVIPAVALIAIKVSNMRSKTDTILFADSLIKTLLTSQKVLEADYNIKSQKIIVLQTKFASSAYINETLVNFDKIVANASAIITKSSNSTKKIFAYVMGVNMRRQKTVEKENNERYKDNEDRDFFKKTNALRSLYLKKKLDVLGLVPNINTQLGLDDNSDNIAKELEEGEKNVAESYKMDEKFKAEDELALDKSMKYTDRTVYYSASDKRLLDTLFKEKPAALKIASQKKLGADTQQDKRIKQIKKELLYAQDQLNREMNESERKVNKVKMDEIQLSAALQHTKYRLAQQKKEDAKRESGMLFSLNRSTHDMEKLKSRIQNMQHDNSELVQSYLKNAMRIFKESISIVHRKLNVSKSSQKFVENNIIQSLKQQLHDSKSSYTAQVLSLREKLKSKILMITSMSERLSTAKQAHIQETKTVGLKHINEMQRVKTEHANEMQRVKAEVHQIKSQLKHANTEYLKQADIKFKAKLDAYKRSIMHMIERSKRQIVKSNVGVKSKEAEVSKPSSVQDEKLAAAEHLKLAAAEHLILGEASEHMGATGAAWAFGTTGGTGSTGSTGSTGGTGLADFDTLQDELSENSEPLDVVVKKAVEDKQNIFDGLEALIKDIAATRSASMESKYLLPYSQRANNFATREHQMIQQYKRMLSDWEKASRAGRAKVRATVEKAIFTGGAANSSNPFVRKEIARASLQKNITVLLAKLSVEKNVQKMRSASDSIRTSVDTKIHKLESMLVEAKDKSRILDEDIRHGIVAEGVSLRKQHTDILKRAISKSKENIRISKLVDKASITTNNFSTPVLDSIPAQYNDCGLISNISCGSTCCPGKFPVCGGTANCPVGKCCSKTTGSLDLKHEYVDVSSVYGINPIKPLLNFKNISKAAYTNEMKKNIRRLSESLVTLRRASNRNKLMQSENEKSIANIRFTIKKESISLNEYKNESRMYNSEIASELASAKNNFALRNNLILSLTAADGINTTNLMNQFFQYTIQSNNHLKNVVGLVEKSRTINTVLKKIKLTGHPDYMGDLSKVIKEVVRNGKEIESAIENVDNNYKLYKELEADAVKFYETTDRS